VASITDRDLTAAAIRGAHGVLFKDYSLTALLHGIREVASGRKCLPTTLIDDGVQSETEQKKRFLGFRALTGREREVMLFAAAGLPNKQIAHHLHLREGTVKSHLHNVYCKTGISNRTSLVAFARSHCDVAQELSALNFKIEDQTFKGRDLTERINA
jgi:DNA-binding NarL/FixJ family response regulator